MSGKCVGSWASGIITRGRSPGSASLAIGGCDAVFRTACKPESAKATLSASVTNGGISVGEFQNLDVSEKSRRRFEAKLNGGGTPIELQTTNGGVRLRPRNSVPDSRTSDERKDR